MFAWLYFLLSPLDCSTCGGAASGGGLKDSQLVSDLVLPVQLFEECVEFAVTCYAKAGCELSAPTGIGREPRRARDDRALVYDAGNA